MVALLFHVTGGAIPVKTFIFPKLRAVRTSLGRVNRTIKGEKRAAGSRWEPSPGTQVRGAGLAILALHVA